MFLLTLARYLPRVREGERLLPAEPDQVRAVAERRRKAGEEARRKRKGATAAASSATKAPKEEDPGKAVLVTGKKRSKLRAPLKP